jgi:adapter protein MecA 1/2
MEVLIMRIERVAQNQLKITLSNDDLRNWDINIDRITRNPDEAQDLFWSLIRQADDETGFFTDGSQLIVEAMPKADGFSMIITKVEEDGLYQGQRVAPRIRPRRELRSKRRSPQGHVLIFRFDRFDALVEACQCIENRFAGYSKLYKYDQAYYLVLDAVNDFLAADLALLLTEYGQKVTDPAMGEGQLSEYGRVLMDENAVGKIVSFF